MADDPKPKMAGPKGKTIVVRGPEDGRYRGGRKFGPIETTIDLSEITAVDHAEIIADPFLSVKEGALVASK